MSVDSRFVNVMEGDEVERFLGSFVLPEEMRAQAAETSPQVRFPGNTAEVLEDVRDVWERRGVLSPAELRAELIGRYTPTADPQVREYISGVELSRNAPETVTGYLSKEHAYVATGLAHLYAKETNRPIAMAEVDFSNMGGTNKEFELRIAQERGIPREEVNPREAERMTDRAVRLLSDSMTSSLSSQLPAGAKIVPIRTGGDELRLLFTGIDDPAQLKKITNKMHSHIEHHVAAMGLQDHPHLKDPDNPVRNGFGAAIAIQDMRQINNPATIIQDMDERIKAEKERIGNLRLGRVDAELLNLQIETALEKGRLAVPDGMEKSEFVAGILDKQSRDAKEFSDKLHLRNPQHNPSLVQGISGFNAYVGATTPLMAASPIVMGYVPQNIANDNHAADNRPAQVAPFASLEERRAAIAQNDFARQSISLSDVDRHFLKQSIKNLTPVDPSAQVMMPKDMISLTEVFAAEAGEFRSRLDPAKPATSAGMAKAGLSSLSEIAPRAVAVSFHNLAGLNNTLGHHSADLVLRHMGTGIVENSLKKAGFKENGGKKPYAIAHHGGGNFSVLLDPAIEGGEGNIKFVSEQTIKDIEDEIGRQVDDLNDKPVAQFLEENGVPVDDVMRAKLEAEGISTFADIKDPKERAMSGNEAIKGRVNGIHAALASEIVSPDADGLKGEALIARVRTKADSNLTDLRDEKILSQHEKNSSLEKVRDLLVEARDKPVMDMSWNSRVADLFQGWRDNPSTAPQLKEIAAVAADVHGSGKVDKESMEYQRLQKVADIVDTPQSPEYHSHHHTRDVTFLTAALAMRDARSEPMSQKFFLNTVTAGAMHDYDHDGKGNGHGDSYEPFRLEHQSVDNVGRQLPSEMRDESFLKMREAVSFTDFSKAEMKPELESPAALLRKIVTQDPTGREAAIANTNVAVDKINPDFDVNRFASSDTARMAKLVAEADLMPSAGLTPEYTLKMTELLSLENPAIKAGPQSAFGFLKFGCANMFVSEAAKEMIVPAYEKNMAVTSDLAAKEAKKIVASDLEVFKGAGNWMMGASDQSNGGFKPAITVSIGEKSPEEVKKIQQVLEKFADPDTGTRVVNGLTERGLAHPTEHTRKTLSLEGGVGLKGIEDMMRASEALKQSGAGHFEWDDDIRDWKNPVRNETLGGLQKRESKPVQLSAQPSAPLPEARPVPAAVAAAPAAAPVVADKGNTSKVIKTVAELEAANPEKRVMIKAGVVDEALAKAEVKSAPVKPSAHAAPSANMERGGKVSGSGVGVGMGIVGLSQKLGEGGTAQADLKNGETKNMAKAGIAADAAAIAVDGADGLASLQKASKGLQAASKVSKVAAPVGIALSAASGVIDYKIAEKQGDGARAADAVGSTTGGIAGAAAGGAIGAKAGAAAGAAIGAFFGGIGAVPGAAIGGIVGGLSGAIGGAFAGAEAGKKVAEVTIKDSLQKKFDEERRAKDLTAQAATTKADNKPDVRQETRQEVKTAYKPDDHDGFAKSAPDLGKAFKSAVEAVPAPDNAANDPRYKVAANNRVHITNGM